MLRERASSEAAYRIDAPNAARRDVLVIALDDFAHDLATEEWRDMSWRGGVFADGSASSGTWRELLDRRTFDAVIMIGMAGCAVDLIGAIGVRCSASGIKLGCVLHVPPKDVAVHADWHLSDVRLWAHTLSLVRDVGLIRGILEALGA